MHVTYYLKTLIFKTLLVRLLEVVLFFLTYYLVYKSSVQSIFRNIVFIVLASYLLLSVSVVFESGLQVMT